jgi:hypothetical protein
MNNPALYREQLGTIFLAEHGAARLELRLADVVEERATAGLRQFSLFFHGPADQILEQGTYSLNHHALGPLALFIVPVIGSNVERIVYQACFSSPVPASVPGLAGADVP